MERFEDTAICLRVWEWSETSQVVCVLTRSHGLVRGLAKGARRPKAAYSGGFEPLTTGELGVISKRGQQLAVLTHWELTRVLAEARRSLEVLYGGLYAVDLAGRLVQDEDPHPGLFDALSRCLPTLAEDAVLAVARFQWAALNETGHRPEVWKHAGDGTPMDLSDVVAFDPALGGIVPDPGVDSPGVWRVRGPTVTCLRSIAKGEVPDAGSLSRAARLLDAYAGWLIGKPLASGNAFWGMLEARGAR